MAATVEALSASLYRAMEAGHERAAGEWRIEWHAHPADRGPDGGGHRDRRQRVAERLRASRMDGAQSRIEQDALLAEAYLFQLAPRLGREAAHAVYEAATRSKAEGIDLHEAVVETIRAGGMPVDDLAELVPGEQTGAARDEALAAVADWRRSRRAATRSAHEPAAAHVYDRATHEARMPRGEEDRHGRDLEASAIRWRGVESMAAPRPARSPRAASACSTKPGRSS